MQSPMDRELELALLGEVARDLAHEELDTLSPSFYEQGELDQHSHNFDFLADALELLPGTTRNQGEFMGVPSIEAVRRIQEVCLWVKSRRLLTKEEENNEFYENPHGSVSYFAPYYILGEKVEKSRLFGGKRGGTWSILLATARPGRNNYFWLDTLKDNQLEARKVVEQQREQPFTTLGHEPREGFEGEPGTFAVTANLPGSLALVGGTKEKTIKIHVNNAEGNRAPEVNEVGGMIERNRGDIFLTDSMWVQYGISEHLARLSGAFCIADDVIKLLDARIERSALENGSSLSLKATMGRIGLLSGSTEVE